MSADARLMWFDYIHTYVDVLLLLVSFDATQARPFHAHHPIYDTKLQQQQQQPSNLEKKDRRLQRLS